MKRIPTSRSVIRTLERMNTLSLLQGLRFLDSFFPSGSFAFSSGLEAAIQGGTVRDAASLERFVSDSLHAGLGTREAVVVGLTWDAAGEGAFSRVIELDLRLNSMHLARDLRRASRQMGRQIGRIAGEHFSGQIIMQHYLAAVETGTAPGHSAVSLGLTLYAAGWDKQESIAGFLYQSVVGYNSAALKLLSIGQRESQRLLHASMPLIADISARAATASDLFSWTPVHDIYAMRHARLESRLFRS
jgi:urease accessory protein